ncbi:MAG: hypothetical protein ACM3WU_00295 [Bacillota bacterium]
MRKQFWTVVAFACGVLMLLDYYLTVPVFKTTAQEIRSWAVIVSAFALGLGGINLIRVHSSNVRKGRQGIFSSVLIAGFVLIVAIGLFGGTTSKTYTFLFNNVVVACGTTMYSMLAFYLASASFRAFRARNLEAAILLVSAVILMLGRVPIGEVISPRLPGIANWIMNVINTAGQRGVMICSALGYISISLRMLLGLERAHGA